MITAELVGGPHCGEVVALQGPVGSYVIPRPPSFVGIANAAAITMSVLAEGRYLRRPCDAQTPHPYDWQGWE